MSTQKTNALRYEEYGKAEEVLSLLSIELPELQAGQALLKVLAAPIL